jgi:hypothetical protein
VNRQDFGPTGIQPKKPIGFGRHGASEENRQGFGRNGDPTGTTDRLRPERSFGRKDRPAHADTEFRERRTAKASAGRGDPTDL